MRAEATAGTEGEGECTLLEWDSAFFGLRIGRINPQLITEQSVAAALEWSRTQRVDCLYYLARADDDASVQLAETAGFHLVDVRLDFSRSLTTAGEAPSTAAGIRPHRSSDVPALSEIAAGSYHLSRSAFDARFPADRVRLFYQEWIRRSCEGYADRVLVAEAEGVPVGYVSCHLQPTGVGRIGLVGVHTKARGRGIAGALMDAALRYFAEAGCGEAYVATQARNIAAQRLYQSKMFLTREAGLWYHKWF